MRRIGDEDQLLVEDSLADAAQSKRAGRYEPVRQERDAADRADRS